MTVSKPKKELLNRGDASDGDGETGDVVAAMDNGRTFRIPLGYVTMNQLVERTGYTRTDIRRFRSRGIVQQERRNGQGWALYKESLVDVLIGIRTQETLQRADRRKQEQVSNKLPPASMSKEVPYSSMESEIVFKGLREGVSLLDICLENPCIHPAIIRAITKDYELMTGSILLRKITIDKMNQLPLEGSFPLTTESDVFEVMKIAASDTKDKCPECKKRPHASSCLPCIKHSLAKQAAAEKKTEESDTQLTPGIEEENARKTG